MTETEKVRIIAEKLMGWPTFEFANDRYFNTAGPKLLLNSVLHMAAPDWMLCDGETMRTWNPYRSWADAGEVLEALNSRDDVSDVLLCTEKDGSVCCIHPASGRKTQHIGDGSYPAAIAEVAFKFVEGR